jgi:glycosyltransferase involved in cell wall biosynthesis
MTITSSGQEDLTCIIPIRNMSGRLGFYFDLLPSHPEVNFVLVHDVEDANAGTELREYIEINNLKNVDYIEGKFGSPGIARNQGIRKISSQWVMFWDSDDEPQINSILNYLNRENFLSTKAEIIIGNFIVKNESGEFSTREIEANLAELGLNPGIWRIIFKSELVKYSHFEDYQMAEDQEFLARILTTQSKFVFTPEVFYTYIKHNQGQLTKSKVAINDLSKSVPRMFSLLRSDETVREFVSVLLVRQMLTGVKNIKGWDLLRFYKLIFFCLLRTRLSVSRRIVAATFFVIARLLSAKISKYKFSNLARI